MIFEHAHVYRFSVYDSVRFGLVLFCLVCVCTRRHHHHHHRRRQRQRHQLQQQQQQQTIHSVSHGELYFNNNITNIVHETEIGTSDTDASHSFN